MREYETLKHQLDWWQVIFSVMFATIALWLLLAAIRYGMLFAGRLTTPISNLGHRRRARARRRFCRPRHHQ